MTTDVYSIDDAEFQGIITAAYQSTIQGLISAGEITPEQGQFILETYALMRFKKGWFGRAVDNLFGTTGKEHGWIAKLVAVELRGAKK